MNCIILAGGRGIRLSPLTDAIPKPLICFKNKPLIEYVLEILYSRFERIVVVVDYLAFNLEEHFKNSKYKEKLIFVQQDSKVKGTMGALVSAKTFISEDFLAICSDNIYCSSDLDNILLRPDSFLIKRVSEKMKLEHYKDAKYSLVKSPNWQYLEAGAWFLSKDFINNEPVLINGTNEFGIPQTIFKDYQKNNLKYKIVFAEYWFPIGTHWEIEYANANFIAPP